MPASPGIVPPTLPQRLLRGLDRLVPPVVQRDGADALRRGRLLAAASLIFPLPTLGFGTFAVLTQGPLNPAGLALLTAAALMTSPLLVMRTTGSVRRAGVVMTLACFTLDFFVAAVSGGFVVSALLWATTTPLIAAYFVGHRLAFVMAGLSTLGYTVLYAAQQAGWPFPAPGNPAAQDVAALLTLIVVTFLLALFGWLYERVTLQGLRRVNGQLREAHAAVQASEARYRMLLEQASDAIFVGRAGVGFTEVNDLACALTGYDRAELMNLRPQDLLDAADVDAFLRTLQTPGQLHQFDAVLRRADGTELPVEVRATHVDGGLVQAIVRDVTARRAYEAELVRARDEAERLSRLKSSFLANMSHEIRTPLTSILGFAEVLTVRASDENQQLAGAIGQAGRRLLHTLNSVLDLSRLESRTFELKLAPCDLVAPTREVLRHFAPQIQAAGLSLNLHLPDAPLPAHADAAAYDRVLSNLVSNAIKFTRRGSLTVTLTADEDTACLVVADTGVGIDDAFLPHLFREFQQESLGIGRVYEGAGLGLSIVQHLVKLMDGHISVASRKHEGTTITVALPLAVTTPAAS